MLQGCITGNGAHFTAMSIRRFKLFESAFDDVEQFTAGMDRLWKEKHGHNLEPRKPKAQKRVKTDADHKYCNGCERVLPVASFSVDRSTPRGLAKRCRECAAKNWKRANHHLCKSCGGWCVGQTCRRCLTIQIRVRDIEMETISTIPRMFADAYREIEIFMNALSPNLSQADRLKLLLEKVCGTSQVR